MDAVPNQKNMENKIKNTWKAHIAMLLAGAMWGLMAPLGKDAMQAGFSGLMMVTFRVTGAAACFWINSAFTSRETVKPHDMLLLFFAAMLSIVLNQCCYTIGLSLTSPVNASIVTTTMPIITMILAALFLHEPVTNKKVIGIFAGALGAFLLITGSVHATEGKAGNIQGDLLCLLAQCSFAVYLTIFKHLIQRYNIVTCMKWMFTYATIVVLPFTYTEFATYDWETVTLRMVAETGFVVVCATYFAYLLMMNGQKKLRPTVVSMYNYVQPIVACLVSVLTGLGIFGWSQALAILLVFGGVYLVTQSKSRADMLREQKAERKKM